jgi:hypothetical protein
MCLQCLLQVELSKLLSLLVCLWAACCHIKWKAYAVFVVLKHKFDLDFDHYKKIKK